MNPEAPRLCDSHLHVVTGAGGWDDAVEATSRHLASLGADRAVLVQAAADGADPARLLDALPRLGLSTRGVVSYAAAVDGDLDTLHRAGVRGLRVSRLGGTPVTVAMLASAAGLAADVGWHLSYYPMDADEWAGLGPGLVDLRATVVVDHMALRTWDADAGPDQPGFRLLLDLVRAGAWVKASGAFRRGTPPHWSEVFPFAAALVEAAPDRVVWGSDWPFLAFDGADPLPEQLLSWLEELLPDDSVRRRVLVDNPALLYDFDNEEES